MYGQAAYYLLLFQLRRLSAPKWLGKCPHCGEWNTYQEELIQKETASERKERSWAPQGKRDHPKASLLKEVQTGKTARMPTPDQEFNRVLRGGIVPGSLVLMGGQPGIGKSTLLLQVAMQLPAKVLYVSGEESEEQVKMRADRVADFRSDCYILTETNTTRILQQAQELQPADDCGFYSDHEHAASGFRAGRHRSGARVRGVLEVFQRNQYPGTADWPHKQRWRYRRSPNCWSILLIVFCSSKEIGTIPTGSCRTLKNRFGSTDEMGHARDAERGIAPGK
jgi:DNA repair protein RadA/Sms